MNDLKHNLIGSWTGASKDASGRLRVVSPVIGARQKAVVSRQDMVKI